MKLNWNSWREGGAKQKSSVGGVWIFSGTTHFKDSVTCYI